MSHTQQTDEEYTEQEKLVVICVKYQLYYNDKFTYQIDTYQKKSMINKY